MSPARQALGCGPFLLVSAMPTAGAPSSGNREAKPFLSQLMFARGHSDLRYSTVLDVGLARSRAHLILQVNGYGQQ